MLGSDRFMSVSLSDGSEGVEQTRWDVDLAVNARRGI